MKEFNYGSKIMKASRSLGQANYLIMVNTQLKVSIVVAMYSVYLETSISLIVMTIEC